MTSLPPPPPIHEAERLEALRSLRILDTPPEPHFDAVCRTAQSLFGVPIALVSLVEEDRQWLKAKCGVDVESTSRDVAFCHHTILGDDVLVVEDAALDPRFSDNPFVTGEPHIRFYAGAPLVLRPGLRMGSLCVIDTVPRTFSLTQRQQLADLAQIVVAHLRLHEMRLASEEEAERRRASEALLREQSEALAQRKASLRETNRLLSLAEQIAHVGHWRVDARSGERTWSDEVLRIYGLAVAPKSIGPDDALALYHPDDREQVRDAVSRALTSGEPFDLQARIVRPTGEVRTIVARGLADRDDAGAVSAIVGTLMDITDLVRARDDLETTSARLHATLETMDQGLMMIDANGVVQVCNERAMALLDLPRDMMEGKPSFAEVRRFQLGQKDFAKSSSAMTEWVENSGLERTAHVYERERPNGTVLEIRTIPLPDGGAVRTYTDVTERKRTEEALREKTSLLSTLR